MGTGDCENASSSCSAMESTWQREECIEPESLNGTGRRLARSFSCLYTFSTFSQLLTKHLDMHTSMVLRRSGVNDILTVDEDRIRSSNSCCRTLSCSIHRQTRQQQ